MANFGTYLRDAREREGVSLRALSRMLGVSHVFLSNVERGKGSPHPTLLAERHWGTLKEALPSIDLGELQRLAVLSRGVSIPLQGQAPTFQEAALAFQRRAQEGSLDESTLNELLRLLGVDE